MFSARKSFACCLLIALLSFTASLPTDGSDATISHDNKTELTQSNSPRTGRVMKFLSEPKPLLRRTKITPRIRSRADHFPPRPLNTNSGNSAIFTRLNNAAQQAPPPPQMLRRVHNGLNAGPQHYQYDGLVKSSRYSPVKGVPGLNAGKASAYRYPQPQYVHSPGAVHPNAVHTGAGNVGVSEQFVHNFKASPVFNGKVIVHQVPEQQQQQHVSPVHQHPIPSIQTQQQFNEQYQQQQQQYLNQREQYPLPVYPVQPQQPHQQPPPPAYQTHYPAAIKPYQQEAASYNPASAPGYSVYEEADQGPNQQLQQQQSQQPQPQNYAYQRDSNPVDAAAAQEAQEYLKFMSTNEYFLPKRDPNYKQMDAERERLQYQQQQQQQQQFIPHSNPHNQQHYVADTPANSYNNYQDPIQVSKLFYHNDPAPSSTIVRGSYQAQQNAFVVNSDGNRAVKHFIPDVPKLPVSTTTTSTTFSPHKRYNQQQNRNRTPEPQRFEFTERDAVLSSYTKAPNTYLRYKAVEPPAPASTQQPTPAPTQPPTQAPITAATPATTNQRATPAPSFYGGQPIKPISESADDVEDGEDMDGQHASHGHAGNSDIYGRIQLRNSAFSSTTEAPIEQKDTEDYCERICANVQDDDEEVVCGSDGYMYTSEAQLECYSSCLHIEVTIQGKGSCSAR